MTLDDQRIEMRETSEPAPHQSYTAPSPIPATTGEGRTLPLVKPAWGRSGDKDDLCNVGVIARHKEYPPYIRSALTGSAFLDWMRHTYDEPENGQSRPYDVSVINAPNFVLAQGLAGGSSVDLHIDSHAKAMAQKLLRMPIPVPSGLISK